MTRIKIVSNPYIHEIKYYRWDEKQEWVPITYENNPNDELVGVKLTASFFPFIVKNIVDTIIKEYSDQDQKIDIQFEGTNDEYQELEELSVLDDYKNAINVECSQYCLENARDILPKIIDVFQRVYDLVTRSVKSIKVVGDDIKKFTDASNDIIPIVVLGNYSSGKSTFINALIGQEILPNGDLPVTAKIYKISHNKESDQALIEVTQYGVLFKIAIDENGYEVLSGDPENQMYKDVVAALEDMKDQSMSYRINQVLTIINDNDIEGEEDDLVSVTIPFKGEVWDKTASQFIIFDTPGSNAASKADHLRVLKVALHGLSNGLPVYIAEYDKLDSTDNEALYNEIKMIPGIDARFTLIIVNKADGARLENTDFTKQKEQLLLSQSVPRNLYSEGMFFVSSIMGLGAKTDGEFNDDYYAEIFEGSYVKYSNPRSRFYKRLYRYNIMPEQLKIKAVEHALERPGDVFVNSGLYTIEDEIRTFADKYSSYNKCQQSQRFLEKIITKTIHEINESTERRQKHIKEREKDLEKGKQALIHELKECARKHNGEFRLAYPSFMQDCTVKEANKKTLEEFKREEMRFVYHQRKKHDYSGQIKQRDAAVRDIGQHFKEGFADVIKKPQLNALKNLGDNLVSDAMSAVDRYKDTYESKKTADSQGSDDFVNYVNETYKEHCAQSHDVIVKQSRLYWEDKMRILKQKLTEIVTESTALDAEKQQKLSQIIADYAIADFYSTYVFKKQKFEARLYLAGFTFKLSERLNVTELFSAYQNQVSGAIWGVSAQVTSNHQDSFTHWADSLLTLIIDNIIDFNPSLHIQSEIIQEETDKIKELQELKHQLDEYNMIIKELMDWKERV